jgi:hypothetical protein
MLDGVNAGILSEHPPRENALFALVELHFLHLNEG